MSSRFLTAIIALAGLVVAASTAAAPSGGAASFAAPRTLVIQKGKIYTFAQDGDYIAWIGGPQYKIHVRGVSKRTGWVVGTAKPGGAVGAEAPSGMALGGKRVLWVQYRGVMSREAAISTAKPGQRRPKLIDTPTVSDYGGTYVAGLAADGEKTIVYGESTIRCTPADDCSTYALLGGGVHRVIAGHKWYPPPIRGIPPAFAIAASQGRVAVVPTVINDPTHGLPEAAPDGPVGVYNLSGSMLARVVPTGTVREVALLWPDLAVLVVRSDGTTAIERYDARSGQLVSAVDVPGASSNLVIGSGGIVFLVGREIFTLSAGDPALLWRSSGKPIGLSIEGRRVAWAVNIGATGRVRALTLPK